MKAICMILLFLLTAAATLAQDGSSPWPPDPKTIFADGVEVISVEFFSDSQTATVDKPTIDTVGRAVLMPDGHIFPWPEAFINASFYVSPTIAVNNNLYLAVNPTSQGEIEDIWQLDTSTGVYSVLESRSIDTVCGTISLDFIKETWVWLQSRQYCEVASGKKTIPLPEDFMPFTDIYSQITRPVPTPDGETLLIFGKQPDNEGANIAYQYHFADESFEKVSVFTQGKALGFEAWAGDTIAILETRGNRSGDTYPEFYGYIALDLEKKDVREWTTFSSLTERSTTIGYRDDKIPMIVTREPFKADTVDVSCRITLDNILARTMVTYTIPSDCRPEFSRDGMDYYRELSSDQKTATVFRIERSTGERTDITSGEIEFIIRVWPDESSIALIVDDSSTVDTLPAQFHRGNYVENARLNFVDLQTNIVWFDTPAYRNDFSGAWTPNIGQITDNWLQIVHSRGGMGFNTLIHVDGSSSQRISLDGVVSTYFGNGWAGLRPREVEDEFGSVLSWSLYHLDTQTTVPVVNVDGFYEYYIADYEFKSLGGDLFEIIVGFYDYAGVVLPETPLARYIIRVPSVEIPVIP